MILATQKLFNLRVLPCFRRKKALHLSSLLVTKRSHRSQINAEVTKLCYYLGAFSMAPRPKTREPIASRLLAPEALLSRVV